MLCVAPRAFSPEPGANETLLDLAGIASVLLPIPLGLAARRLSGIPPKAALGLAIAADVALLWQAQATQAASEPLLAGYYVAAPFVWATLAAIAATIADRYLGISFKNKRLGAAIGVLALGIFVFKDASPFLASPDAQWRKVLTKSPSNLDALGRSEAALRTDAALDRAMDACLADSPDACLCRTWRAEIRLDRDDVDGAIADARAGAACEDVATRARAVLAVALLRKGDAAAAREEIAATTSTNPPHPRGELALALLSRSTGDFATATEAASKAEAGARTYVDPWPPRDAKHVKDWLAVSPYLGVERDAAMVRAMVAMDQKRYDDARPVLAGILATHPDDAEAIYDIALIEDLEGHFNPAREGYLRALKLRPGLAAARYNLALLTLRFGVLEEARHHAEKFKRDWPNDPRAAELELRIESLPR